ncbi:TetR/AcrR family transcriptional regulator [Actinoplanes auranticolor]|uniref:TetR family transcriptional regulator n=1 Tax=Actinoplanes auranticolor TaxID=47988 RepID=A0A919W5K4_9ACTN|nr:TetR family transcriptional regulator [Actinoplanes auranticolor]GIM80668.1 TetR family transcriptional regulator [Actinoplanes auranticolor]
MSQASGSRRTRNPEEKQAAIIAAARAVFAERGYDRSTIREIARRAGVTHGLVILHFTSKEKLLLAAGSGPRILVDHVPGDLEGLAGRIARAFVTRMESADGADPFIAVVRSAAGDQQAAKALLQAMREESVAAYRQVLPSADVDARVDLVGAHLIGVTLNRYVLGGGPLATMPPEDLIARLTTSLHAILLE